MEMQIIDQGKEAKDFKDGCCASDVWAVSIE